MRGPRRWLHLLRHSPNERAVFLMLATVYVAALVALCETNTRTREPSPVPTVTVTQWVEPASMTPFSSAGCVPGVGGRG